jgi:hypothetical protein
MPKITKITPRPERERVWVYVDGEFCCSIRERTFPAMGLHVGRQISCDEIKELEKFHWKHAYGAPAWQKEQVRLQKVKALIETIDPRLAANITGFGAGTDKFIAAHPKESGKPDIEVSTKDNPGAILLLVEVTGTEMMRGGDYWIRPDKLHYARNHPDQDAWIILHYAGPVERFVFIKPDGNREYPVKSIVIKGSTERYVVLDDSFPEIRQQKNFEAHLKAKLPKLVKS